MNKSYISPTKLSCLALCCMISTLTMGFNALILCVCASAVFVFAISIVSNLEKVASNHIRFVIYTLIVSSVFTIIKIVFGYINSVKLLEISMGLDYAFLASIALSILPIYFMHKESTGMYYTKTVVTALIFTLSGIFISIVVEFINFGSCFGYVLFETEPSILGSPFISFVILAFISVCGTYLENAYSKMKLEERVIIDRYKILIREHQLNKINKNGNQDNKKSNVGTLIEGGNE